MDEVVLVRGQPLQDIFDVSLGVQAIHLGCLWFNA